MKHPIVIFLLFFSFIANAQKNDDVFVKSRTKTELHFFIESDFTLNTYHSINTMFVTKEVTYEGFNTFGYHVGAELRFPYLKNTIPQLSLGYTTHEYNQVIEMGTLVFQVGERGSTLLIAPGARHRFLTEGKIQPYVQGNVYYNRYFSSESYYQRLKLLDEPLEDGVVYTDDNPTFSVGVSLHAGIELPVFDPLKVYVDVGYRFLRVISYNNVLGEVYSPVFKAGILF